MSENVSLQSPITNKWGEVVPKKIKTEHFKIYTGTEGYSYNHHHQITSFHGKLIATWSNGIKNEDDPGQRMMISTSIDGGVTWSEERAMVDRKPGKFADAIVSAMGVREHEGKLIAYYNYYEYPEKGLVPGSNPPERPSIGKALWPEGELWSFDEHTETVVSEDGGDTWSQPVGRIEAFTANLKPEAIQSGRLIIPGQLCYGYTDDPRGISGWKRPGIPGLPEDYSDAPGIFQRECRRQNLDSIYCEASFFQTDDEVIHMMLRSFTGYLGVTESHDHGETWSKPILTHFTDSRNRFHFGRLPDGRFIAVSCPAPGSRRTPLILQISEDGVVFDKHYVLADGPSVPARISGHHKGGRYGYPTYHIMGNTMFVIYSIEKEDIMICRFDLEELNN